jgi:Flp pilus assembly protein TadG
MRSPRRHHSNVRRQRGLAWVEFVITAPILMVLTFGSFEFSHYLLEYSRLNDAVNNGASWLATQALQGSDGVLATGSAWTTLVGQTQNMVVYGNAAGTGTPVLPSLTKAEVTVSEATSANTVTVSVAYPYISVFGSAIPLFFMGGSLSTNYTLSITATMEAI